MKRGAAIRVGTLAAVLFNVSCARPIPPVPVVSLDGLDADVRVAIEKARDEAVAAAHERASFGTPRYGARSSHALLARRARL